MSRTELLDLLNIPLETREKSARLAARLQDEIESWQTNTKESLNNFDILYAALLLAGARLAMTHLDVNQHDRHKIRAWAVLTMIDYTHHVSSNTQLLSTTPMTRQ